MFQMTKARYAIIGLVVAIILASAHMARYEVVASDRTVVVLDRWTGVVKICPFVGVSCGRVFPP
jgi:hypothetical protein